MLIPTTLTISLAATSVIALLISIHTLDAVRQQASTETRAALFAHARDAQGIWMDHPELYPYFYENKSLDDVPDKETHNKLMVLSEMLADMIDHAAASKSQLIAQEGWKEYAQQMYDTSEAFRVFMSKDGIREWYPSIEDWIKFNQTGHR